MSSAPLPANEDERLAVLRAFGILDTPASAQLDRHIHLARYLMQTPTALLTFLDETRMWCKAREGFDRDEIPREISFCSHTILQEEPLIVPDARLDERFNNNPLVTGAPGIRFYAGLPIKAPHSQYNLGAFCVIDTQPRTLTEKEIDRLYDLTNTIERVLFHPNR